MSSEQLEKYIINVIDNNAVISRLELIRHLNPILIERIVRSLPVSSFILVFKDRILLKIGTSYAVTKKKTEHVEGDISFDSLNNALVIYTERTVDDLETIGKVREGLENLYKLKTGGFVLLKL